MKKALISAVATLTLLTGGVAATAVTALPAGASQGCATTVDGLVGGPTGSIDCLRSLVVGGRWCCAPMDGWARAFLGSCTIL